MKNSENMGKKPLTGLQRTDETKETWDQHLSEDGIDIPDGFPCSWLPYAKQAGNKSTSVRVCQRPVGYDHPYTHCHGNMHVGGPPPQLRDSSLYRCLHKNVAQVIQKFTCHCWSPLECSNSWSHQSVRDFLAQNQWSIVGIWIQTEQLLLTKVVPILFNLPCESSELAMKFLNVHVQRQPVCTLNLFCPQHNIIPVHNTASSVGKAKQHQNPTAYLCQVLLETGEVDRHSDVSLSNAGNEADWGVLS